MQSSIVEAFQRFGCRVTISPFRADGFGLPVLMKRQYRFFEARLEEGIPELILAECKSKLPVAQLQIHHSLLEESIGKNVILVFEKLGTRERERLIKRGVSFMVPGRFVHARVLGVSGVQPGNPKRIEELIEREALSSWAEAIVIKQLLTEEMQGKSGKEISSLLGVTPIMISHAALELENHDLCERTRRGKTKLFQFENNQVLWKKARSLLASPVVGTVRIGELLDDFVKAGETALACYSMLADTGEQVYAVSSREFVAAKRKGIIAGDMLSAERYQLQLWNRDPKVLAENGVIDKISVYLSLKDNLDERVQIELEKMMDSIGLSIENDA